MIYSHNKTNRHEGKEFSLSVDANKITLSFTVEFSDAKRTKTIEFNLEECKGKVMQAEMVNCSDRGDVIIHPMYSTADYALDGVDARYEPRSIARIALSEDGTDGILHIIGHVDKPPEEIELIERDTQTCLPVFLSEYCPYFKTTFKKYQSKKKISDNVDMRNSLAYLETQVDALTRIVLSLVSDDSEARRILAKAEESSILNIKTEDKLLEEFENKKTLRAYQEAFYTDIKKLEESTEV